jgi:hypothetical protein
MYPGTDIKNLISAPSVPHSCNSNSAVSLVLSLNASRIVPHIIEMSINIFYFVFLNHIFFCESNIINVYKNSSSSVIRSIWVEGWYGLPGNPDHRGETPWYRRQNTKNHHLVLK